MIQITVISFYKGESSCVNSIESKNSYKVIMHNY